MVWYGGMVYVYDSSSFLEVQSPVPSFERKEWCVCIITTRHISLAFEGGVFAYLFLYFSLIILSTLIDNLDHKAFPPISLSPLIDFPLPRHSWGFLCLAINSLCSSCLD